MKRVLVGFTVGLGLTGHVRASAPATSPWPYSVDRTKKWWVFATKADAEAWTLARGIPPSQNKIRRVTRAVPARKP